MSESQQFPALPSQSFRLGAPLDELLQQPSREVFTKSMPLRKAEILLTSVFPQYPTLFHELDVQDIVAHEDLRVNSESAPMVAELGTTRLEINIPESNCWLHL